MHDPALFHVILLSAAVHLNFVNNVFTSADVVYHRLKAIRSVNERLKTSPNAISNEMLHVVMFMAITEASFFQASSARYLLTSFIIQGVVGDQAAAMAHLDGLNRMIEIRGGFSALDDKLQQKVCL
jgi:Fungal specific transcription factor domain